MLLGIVTVVKLEHPENVLSVEVTPSGIVILVNLLHLENALIPIDATLLGMFTLVKLSQPLNAFRHKLIDGQYAHVIQVFLLIVKVRQLLVFSTQIIHKERIDYLHDIRHTGIVHTFLGTHIISACVCQ